MTAPFHFCPRCGASTISYEDRRLGCESCGFTLYINTATAVGGLIEVEGGLLMAVRAREPGKGLLDLPGGFLNSGKTPRLACVVKFVKSSILKWKTCAIFPPAQIPIPIATSPITPVISFYPSAGFA